MALLLLVGFFNLARTGVTMWPKGYRPNSAPASIRRRVPHRFLPMRNLLDFACNGFSDTENANAVLQWAFNARKALPIRSTVLKSIVPGRSHSHLVEQYKLALEVKVRRIDEQNALKHAKKHAPKKGSVAALQSTLSDEASSSSCSSLPTSSSSSSTSSANDGAPSNSSAVDVLRHSAVQRNLSSDHQHVTHNVRKGAALYGAGTSLSTSTSTSSSSSTVCESSDSDSDDDDLPPSRSRIYDEISTGAAHVPETRVRTKKRPFFFD